MTTDVELDDYEPLTRPGLCSLCGCAAVVNLFGFRVCGYHATHSEDDPECIVCRVVATVHAEAVTEWQAVDRYGNYSSEIRTDWDEADRRAHVAFLDARYPDYAPHRIQSRTVTAWTDR